MVFGHASMSQIALLPPSVKLSAVVGKNLRIPEAAEYLLLK